MALLHSTSIRVSSENHFVIEVVLSGILFLNAVSI
jgi:hypothetical protein